MSDINPRFDVHYYGYGPSLDYHFCREWEDDVGCYGTNPNHGYTFDEAKTVMAQWHRERAEYWEKLTLAQWGDMPSEEALSPPATTE